MSIMMTEVLKLLHHAGATDVCFIRVGTSGGVGVPPGSVVVSSGALNPLFQEKHIAVPSHFCFKLMLDFHRIEYILGKRVEFEAKLDSPLPDELAKVGLELGMGCSADGRDIEYSVGGIEGFR